MKIYLYIKALSDFSSRMQFIAVTSLLVSIPGAASYLTVYFMARQLAGITASPLAGLIADRYSRRRIMIIAEWLSAGSLAMLLFTDHPYAVIASAFLLGMTYTLFDVSFRAALPNMAGEENIMTVNALLIRFSSVISIAGFALGGIIVHLTSYKMLILFDICTYIVSAGVLMKMNWGKAEKKMEAEKKQHRKWRVRAVLNSTPLLILLMCAAFLYPFAASAYQYGLPLLSANTESPGLYNGFLWSSAAIGSFISSFFFKKSRQLSSKLYVTTLLSFAFFIILTYSRSFSLWTFALLLLAGFFEGRCQTYYYSLLQQADESIRGRLFGIQSLLARFGYFAGFLLTPFIANMVSISLAVIIVQILLTAGILAAFIMYRRFGHS